MELHCLNEWYYIAYIYGITLSICISLHCQYVWNYIAYMYGIRLPIWPLCMEFTVLHCNVWYRAAYMYGIA